MKNVETSLRDKFIKSIGWSVTQNWGGKVLSFVIFIILARLVTPEEFGIVSSALLFLYFLGLVAEFGFGDALIQKATLKPEDINLPFYVSMGLSVSLGIIAALFSTTAERLLGVEKLAPLITAFALLAPISTAAIFQEYLYRRELLFKKLALRSLLGTTIGGTLSIGIAFAGCGVWALVAYSYITTLFSLLWLWARPVWKPSLKIDKTSFKGLWRFGSAIFGMRLLDFTAVRSADFIIVTLFGPVAFGIFSAGSKLYQTLMLLLQSALSDVALTFLSKIAHDRDRIRSIYLKSVTTSIALVSPIFVMCAAISPEICDVLFGKKWEGIEKIVEPFLLVGSIQCVQFLNGSYYSALGKPSYLLYFNILKIAATGIVFFLCRNSDVVTFVRYFCLAQTITTVPTFYFLCRLLKLPLYTLISNFLPFILCLGAAFGATLVFRNTCAELIPSHPFFRGFMVGGLFAISYGVCVSYKLYKNYKLERCLLPEKQRTKDA